MWSLKSMVLERWTMDLSISQEPTSNHVYSVVVMHRQNAHTTCAPFVSLTSFNICIDKFGLGKM